MLILENNFWNCRVYIELHNKQHRIKVQDKDYTYYIHRLYPYFKPAKKRAILEFNRILNTK